MSVFSFLDDNLSTYQWIFTKLGMCIALILWRSAQDCYWENRQFLTELSARNTFIFYFHDKNLSKHNGFSPNLICALILWRLRRDCSWANFVNFDSYLPET